jgi:hypothetical protein
MTSARVEIDRRTPARKMTREDLANVTSGGLMLGCCTQGCCKPPVLFGELNPEQAN